MPPSNSTSVSRCRWLACLLALGWHSAGRVIAQGRQVGRLRSHRDTRLRLLSWATSRCWDSPRREACPCPCGRLVAQPDFRRHRLNTAGCAWKGQATMTPSHTAPVAMASERLPKISENSDRWNLGTATQRIGKPAARLRAVWLKPMLIDGYVLERLPVLLSRSCWCRWSS